MLATDSKLLSLRAAATVLVSRCRSRHAATRALLLAALTACSVNAATVAAGAGTVAAAVTETAVQAAGAQVAGDRVVEPRVVSATELPAGFVGHLAYESASGRLWLLSFGPPANPAAASSRLFELDPQTGAVLAEAALPLQGSFGPPAAVDGYLYAPVFWESQIYKIATDRERFGTVVETVPVPGVAELGMEGDGHYRYPFLEFTGLAVTPEKHLLLYANHAGELITLARDSGALVSRVKTLPGLGAIAGLPSADGRFLLLANHDADDFAVKEKVMGFAVRPIEVPVPTKRSRWGSFTARPEAKRVSWLLLDAATGAAEARVDLPDSPAYAGSLALVARQSRAGTPFGSLSFLTLGSEGLLTLEWTPSRGSG